MSQVGKQDAIEAFIAKVRGVLQVVEGDCCKEHRYFEEGFRELAEATDQRYPQDTFDLLDMAQAAQSGGLKMCGEEARILKALLEDSWWGSSNYSLRWKYNNTAGWLKMMISPKDGRYVTILFRGENNHGPTTYPFTVTVDVYTDMDDTDSHGDCCPVYHMPISEHDEDCPIAKLDHDTATDADYEEAERNCYCSDGDCDCEPQVDWSRSWLFKDDEEFKDAGAWLSHVLRTHEPYGLDAPGEVPTAPVIGEFYLDPRNPDSAYVRLDEKHELIVHKTDEGIVLDVWKDGGAESLWSAWFTDSEMLPDGEKD